MCAFARIVADKRENHETKWHQTVVPNHCAKIARDNRRNKMLARLNGRKKQVVPKWTNKHLKQTQTQVCHNFFFRVLVVCVRQAFKRVCELTESSKAQRRRKGNDDGAATKRMMQEEKEQKQQEEKNASQGRNPYVARGEQSLAAVPSRCVCNTQTLGCGWHRCGTPQFAFFRATLIHNCVGFPRRMAESQLCCDHDVFRAPENWSSFLTARGVPHLLVLLVVFVAAAVATAAAAVATAAWPVTIHCIHSTAI